MKLAPAFFAEASKVIVNGKNGEIEISNTHTVSVDVTPRLQESLNFLKQFTGGTIIDASSELVESGPVLSVGVHTEST